MVRGVDSQDYYTDSRQAYEITLVKDAAIADAANLDWLELHFRRGGIPEHLSLIHIYHGQKINHNIY